MEARMTAAAQLAGLTEAVANLRGHHHGRGGENAERQLSLALAKAIGEGLMLYYLEKKGYAEPEELYDDPFYSTGVFGRVQPWEKSNVIDLFRQALYYDLDTNELFCKVQAFFLGLADPDSGRRTRNEAAFAYLPEQPLEDHITNSAAFFALLP